MLNLESPSPQRAGHFFGVVGQDDVRSRRGRWKSGIAGWFARGRSAQRARGLDEGTTAYLVGGNGDIKLAAAGAIISR